LYLRGPVTAKEVTACAARVQGLRRSRYRRGDPVQPAPRWSRGQNSRVHQPAGQTRDRCAAALTFAVATQHGTADLSAKDWRRASGRDPRPWSFTYHTETRRVLSYWSRLRNR